ncbi:hypothetical protein BC567DRAFT_226655 [Phyllosticta citribraziliensis]
MFLPGIPEVHEIEETRRRRQNNDRNDNKQRTRQNSEVASASRQPLTSPSSLFCPRLLTTHLPLRLTPARKPAHSSARLRFFFAFFSISLVPEESGLLFSASAAADPVPPLSTPAALPRLPLLSARTPDPRTAASSRWPSLDARLRLRARFCFCVSAASASADPSTSTSSARSVLVLSPFPTPAPPVLAPALKSPEIDRRSDRPRRIEPHGDRRSPPLVPPFVPSGAGGSGMDDRSAAVVAREDEARMGKDGMCGSGAMTLILLSGADSAAPCDLAGAAASTVLEFVGLSEDPSSLAVSSLLELVARLSFCALGAPVAEFMFGKFDSNLKLAG